MKYLDYFDNYKDVYAHKYVGKFYDDLHSNTQEVINDLIATEYLKKY